MEVILVSSVLFLYLVIGFLPSDQLTNNDDYLIASRRLNILSSGLSMLASKVGGGLFITYSSLFFIYGYPAMFFFIGATVGHVFFLFFMKKIINEDFFKNQKDMYSLADFFSHYFGKKSAKLVGFLIALNMFGLVIINLAVGSHVISIATGWPALFVLIMLSIIICSYLLYGGFYSVIRTDAVQAMMIIIIFSVILFYLFSQQSNYSLSLPFSSSISPANIISFFLLGLLFPLGSAELHQRVIACKNKQVIKRSLMVSSFFYLLIGIILTLTCVALSGVDTVMVYDTDLRLSIGLKSYLSNNYPLLATLWIIGFISIAISSADTFIYASAASIVQDILGEKEDVRKIKKLILLITVTGSTLSALMIVADLGVDTIVLAFVSVTLVIAGLLIILRMNDFLKFNDHLIAAIGWMGILAATLSVIFLLSNKNPMLSLSGFIVVLIGAFLAKIFSMLRLRVPLHKGSKSPTGI